MDFSKMFGENSPKIFTIIKMPDSMNDFMGGRGVWKLDRTTKECDLMFIHRPKIFIIGPYKVGKTTVVNWITNCDIAKPDSVTNTKGEYIFCGKVFKKQVVIVDTEGMFQPVIGAEPHVMREFIIEQTMNTATQVLFVLDLLHDHELALLNLLIHSFAHSHNSVNGFHVIHNRKDLNDQKGVDGYRDQLLRHFSDKNNPDFTRLEEDRIVQAIEEKRSVCHYVLGHQKHMKAHNAKHIEHLQTVISVDSGSTVTFSQGLTRALKYTMTKYYQVPLDQALDFIDMKLDAKELKIKQPIKPRTGLTGEWVPICPMIEIGEPYKTEKGEWYQVVYISCPGMIQTIPQSNNDSPIALDGRELFGEKIVKKTQKKNCAK